MKNGRDLQPSCVLLLQASVRSIQAADESPYLTATPAIKGVIPRLVRELLVDTFNLLVEIDRQADEANLLVSGELQGALALGYDGEIGNFILRQKFLLAFNC